MRYEVHISREIGVIERPDLVRVECEAGVGLSLRQSIAFASDDLEVVRYYAEVHEATARRSDDRHAWILDTHEKKVLAHPGPA